MGVSVSSTRFVTLDLSLLPPAKVVEELDFEAILADQKAWVMARWEEVRKKRPGLPAFDTLGLETEPMTIILESYAFRETIVRGVMNDKAKASMLAYASGSDLDHIGAGYDCFRLTRSPADPTASPPVAAVMESDEDYRSRIQLAPNAFSTLGPAGAYIYWARTVAPTVKDANPVSPGVSGKADGRVDVYVAGFDGQPVPDSDINALVAFFTREDVASLTDIVSVIRAEVLAYDYEAVLQIPRGPDPAAMIAAATAAVRAYGAERYKIGATAYAKAMDGAALRPGAANLIRTAPAGDIECGPSQIPWLRSVRITTQTI
ncbi:phage-related baseplate assembly protein [Rhodopseudomonas faecalis]|uniref:Phage-related baseplate assembly protein n=1 Tax=Rhodopseudomonas faecalis TaxID=99655 RepID=A0A318TPV5_9BRAD|nr:baseplate J/gp47 family protein [Rhodopseudomonas faecalis]PYF05038.1 phage-related baseplate assembly protein [Rhodopseudomonas faecalis]